LSTYRIATIKGDGICPEVTRATMQVLDTAFGSDVLDFDLLEGGADCCLKTDKAVPDATLANEPDRSVQGEPVNRKLCTLELT